VAGVVFSQRPLAEGILDDHPVLLTRAAPRLLALVQFGQEIELIR
jgi:hypothetical protein